MNKNLILKVEELTVGKFYSTNGGGVRLCNKPNHRGETWMRDATGSCRESIHLFPMVEATKEEVEEFNAHRKSVESYLVDYYNQKAKTGGYSGD
jgi:hypothetical protein